MRHQLKNRRRMSRWWLPSTKCCDDHDWSQCSVLAGPACHRAAAVSASMACRGRIRASGARAVLVGVLVRQVVGRRLRLERR